METIEQGILEDTLPNPFENITTSVPSESSDGTIDVGIVRDNFAAVNTYELGSERDVYQFEIADAAAYDIELNDLEANLNLSIKNSAGNTIYSSSAPGNEAEFIDADLQSGIYTAVITGQGEAETDYKLTITKTEDIGTDTEQDDSEPILSQGDTVYRFLETEARTQFYTTSEVERDSIIENLDNYEYEGESFVGAPNPEDNDITGIVSVYRFFNTSTGVHLYTSSAVEQDFVRENLSNYVSEGISYYGYESQIEDSIGLYRFYNSDLDAHFYTPSLTERDEFLADPAYTLEGDENGIVYYIQSTTEI